MAVSREKGSECAASRQIHRMGGNERGDGVLVDQLLLSLAVDDHREAVEAAYHAAHLKAIHEENGDELSVAPGLVEEKILQILCFLHHVLPFARRSPLYHGAGA